VQRGNNRQPIFFHEDDYGVYLEYLCEALVKNNCRLYAFVLMTNPVHLLALGETSSGVSGLMQSVGRRYVRYINGLYRVGQGLYSKGASNPVWSIVSVIC